MLDPLIYCTCYSPRLPLPKVNSSVGYCFIPLHPLRLNWISGSSFSLGYTLRRQEVCGSAIRNTFTVIVPVCLQTLTQLSTGAGGLNMVC